MKLFLQPPGRESSVNKIIIDGYNLIHRVPELAKSLETSLEHARDGLVRRLRSYALRKQVEITVVFDGTAPPLGIDEPQAGRRLKIVFSRSPTKADPVIQNLIQNAPNRKCLTIVSDDAEIVRFARTRQASVLSTRAFFDRLRRRSQQHDLQQKFDGGLTEEELAEWLKLFGEK
ncbi:MAG: NYN domain-containing protein [bacterium]